MKKSTKKHYRVCHLCEATCGLEIIHDGEEIISIKGDKKDPLSRGFFCPKALSLKDIQNDPDRLKHPVLRKGDQWEKISWEKAFDITVSQIFKTREQYGKDSIGIYMGNPCVHNYGMMTHPGHFLSLLKTKNRYSATSVDQLPHHLIGMWMFGHQMLVPIPDIDRSDYFLMLGANPVASNGSLWTVPDVKKRIKEFKNRGGKLVTVDPRYSETGQLADEHLFIRPGTDAAFLSAILNTMFAEKLDHPDHLSPYLEGWEAVKAKMVTFTAEKAASVTGIEADTIRRIAREIAGSKNGICYGRMGISVQTYGTVCQWLVQLINIATGSLDKPGGVLFTKPAFDTIGDGQRNAGRLGARHSRVSGLPDFSGELPVVAMAEEILTPGEGQIKAMIIAAANPVLTVPNGRQLEKGLESLDFMVCIDPYINETTRFADLILPPTFALEHDHFDIVFNVFAARNCAGFNQPLFPKAKGAMHDWEIFTELGKRTAAKLDVKPRPNLSPKQFIDLGLQIGPYSEKAGYPEPISISFLEKSQRRVDFGPLEPSLPDRLLTKDKKIQCAPELLMADLERVESDLLSQTPTDQLLLIGRRHLFSANSWLHNYDRLVKGKNRCLLFIHPDDAATLKLKEEQLVKVTSRVGEVEVAVSITDEVMKGIVSLPHGWGHNRKGTRLSIAEKHPGVSVNDLTDEKLFDPLSGNGALNEVPVTIVAI